MDGCVSYQILASPGGLQISDASSIRVLDEKHEKGSREFPYFLSQEPHLIKFQSDKSGWKY